MALGVSPGHYIKIERGERRLTADLIRKAADSFAVSADAILAPEQPGIPVRGLVGAGPGVEMIADDGGADAPDVVDLPKGGDLAALRVRGDSQFPRFLDGEYILYNTRPADPAELIGHYVVAHIACSGEYLIKILARSMTGGTGKWMLRSHNAPDLDGIDLLAVYKVVGTVTDGQRAALPAPLPRKRAPRRKPV